MTAPKQLFWVEVLPGGQQPMYPQIWGGPVPTMRDALDRCKQLALNGVLTEIHETQEIKWVVSDGTTEEMEDSVDDH